MSRSTASPPSELGVVSERLPTRQRQAMRPRRVSASLLGARTAPKSVS
jgi:hypothetical protein